ncbi:glycosyltransferase family 4 protein [Autumnicola edwardsiae]|uniref:Glycosyltransferase family 4 protein n=1 Tax=Autumnicola edwardsiae TaxID=3075594 RepID=A0ABU3CYD4_9FLAO|nr:glycosyltransferase family 4 protein [Zunongwangia sp. F297]MDT0651339.1 glycosyltransferase family 4 protein [Zunongwangia sp. F297]
MRILFYAHSSTLYGANRSLMELILGMKEYDPEINIILILPEKGIIEPELNKKNIPYKVVHHFNWFYNKAFGDKWKKKSPVLFKLWRWRNKWMKLFYNRWAVRKHLKYAKQFSPDFIYVNSSLNPMGLIVAKKLNAKCIWHHRETLNDDVYGFYTENITKFLKYYNSADLHFFPSQFLKRNYFGQFGQVNSKVVYNSILLDAENFSKRKLHKPLCFGIVGRINDQKNQKEIIRLFKTPEVERLSVELHIIGHGDEQFQEWLRKQKIPNVIFHNFLDRREIYEKLDFLISNARYEAFGRTVAEANCAGIPVIVRSSGALPELVQEGYNGYIYKDLSELKSIINKLNVLEDEEYQELSEKSILYANKKYNYLSIAGKVYGELKFLNPTV